MCRLFGFRSVIQSQVHRSLLAADNALATQSACHPDGWGVAYYVDGTPHLTRSAAAALDDALFRRVSGVVSSETVVAHIRKATTGPITVLNAHPFQHGRWVFAHNGQVNDFPSHQKEIEAGIAPRFRRYILGDTDSERLFFLFLTHLLGDGASDQETSLEAIQDALHQTQVMVRAIADGPDADTDEKQRSSMTLLVTDGVRLAAVEGGKDLFYSTYKTRCSDREACPHFLPVCEAVSPTGFVNHLVVSSEPIRDENVWLRLEGGRSVGVDDAMMMRIRAPRRTQRYN